MNNTNMEEFEDDDEMFGDEPFGEEFERDDVVKSKTVIDEDDEFFEKTLDVDVDSILNYDEERRKRDHFEKGFFSDDEDRTQDEILQKNFRDFLVARKITGKFEGIGSYSRIPAERITESGKKVEIKDDPGHEVKGDKKTTVVVSRNEEGDITGFEVLCSCGEKTTISIDFGDKEGVDGDDVTLMENEGIPNIGLGENFANLEIADEEIPDSFTGEEQP